MARLEDHFDLRYGHSLELNALKRAKRPDGVNFVGRAMGNNGVTARVYSDVAPAPAGDLSVALGGNGILSTFVQPEPFVCGRDVMILTPRSGDMSIQERLFWGRCIWSNRYRFSYGRQANRTLGSLIVPDAAPKWIASIVLPSNDALAHPAGEPIDLGKPRDWASFVLGELFTIKKGKRVTKANRDAGPTRFIGASEKNNGITDHVNLEPNFPAGCITVPYNGSVGWAFYQDEPFFACDDVNVLVPNQPADKLALLLVCAMIRHERSRFTYGYKWTMGRMQTSTIKLPATANGEPDWAAMKTYVQGLPFSAAVAA